MDTTQVHATPRLEALIQEALQLAHEWGSSVIAERLAAALTAMQGSYEAIELDLLATEVRRQGRLIALSRSERALLATLALHKRPVTREELVELLYAHVSTGIAVSQLKVYVHRVRRRLGDALAIVCTGDGYMLGPSVAVDLRQCELEVALAMRTRGGLPASQYARLVRTRLRLLRRDVAWLRTFAAGADLERRLDTLLFDVTLRIAEAALAQSDITLTTLLSHSLSELDPSDERTAELAIRLNLARGDEAGARRAFHRYSQLLEREFAAKPSPSLCRLITSVAGQAL
jgi:DNA-binding SARP family transcriptional activator